MFRWSNFASNWWYSGLFSFLDLADWMLYSESRGQVSSSNATEGLSELYITISGLYGVINRVDGIVGWGASPPAGQQKHE